MLLKRHTTCIAPLTILCKMCVRNTLALRCEAVIWERAKSERWGTTGIQRACSHARVHAPHPTPTLSLTHTHTHKHTHIHTRTYTQTPWLAIHSSVLIYTLCRCEAVTGGSEVKAMAEALDTQLSAFVGRLIGLARTLQQQVGDRMTSKQQVGDQMISKQ